MIEVTGRVGRRRGKLLSDGLAETRVTLENETGKAGSHTVKKWLWESLWTCSKADYRVIIVVK